MITNSGNGAQETRCFEVYSRYRHFHSWPLQQNKGYPYGPPGVNRHRMVYGLVYSLRI